MLWLRMKQSSHQIVSCNLHKEGDKHSVWVERINGKNMKILESPNEEEVKEIRDMIDYAIKNSKNTLELDI